MMASCYNFFMEEMTWKPFFDQQRHSLYFENMLSFIEKAYQKTTVYPKHEDIFKAFKLVKPYDVKVVILGQDPYHQPGQAMGLAFSVPTGVKPPPSLVNIFKEIENDSLGPIDFANGDLSYLAKQGVLLLNTILTVEMGKPLSHNISEYHSFVSKVFEYLSSLNQPIVYLLWGNNAHTFASYITGKKALIIQTTHPSPLSANRGGFFHLHQFSRTNQYLMNHGLTPIKWNNKN